MSIILRDNKDYTPANDVVASADRTKGFVELINHVYVSWFADVLSGIIGATYGKAEQARMTKDTGTGEAITAWEKVYYHPTNQTGSKTKGSGYVFVGWATEDAAASDTSVRINFDGRLHAVIS